MNEQSWQRAENIFHGALELAPETRFAFLDEACGPDLALRREVDSLLAHDSETDSTFAGPPEIAGGNYEVPRTIAHYHVSAKLGQGGMGTVYRATDSRLGRDVAIKLMPRSFAGDDGRSARFTREAKVLASLNHPHICTVHGLEDAAGQPAIVMELVEGETLAQRLLKGPLPLHELLEFAAQIADALAASHRGGVIHRDLKPSNIMLAGLGGHPVVKVLDFGLATPQDRLSQAQSSARRNTCRPNSCVESPPIPGPTCSRWGLCSLRW